jgi:hypothetical protein
MGPLRRPDGENSKNNGGEAVCYGEAGWQGGVQVPRRHGVPGDMPGPLLQGHARPARRRPGGVAGVARGGALVRLLLGHHAVRALGPHPTPHLQGQARRQVSSDPTHMLVTVCFAAKRYGSRTLLYLYFHISYLQSPVENYFISQPNKPSSS